MCLDDVFHNAQADAHALRLTPQLGTETVEKFKDLFMLLRWNAFTVVCDPELQYR